MPDEAVTVSEQLWQEYARFFARELELMEPKDIHAPSPEEERAARAKLRRQAYTVSDITAFVSLPPEDWPLYFLPDRAKLSVAAQECGEKCVHLQPLARKRKSRIVFAPGTTPYSSVAKRMYLRESVASKLFLAEEALSHLTGGTLSFQVTDALRPVELQREYFTQAQKVFIGQGFSGEELYQRTAEVVADPDLCPPHATGGAVDLTLIDIATGQQMDMGTGIDDIGNERIYTWHPDLTADQRRHRLLLFTAMSQAGFVNMPGEWWHYSYGDREWALRTGKTHAMYGVVEK